MNEQNNILTVQLTPEDIKKILYQQIGFFKDVEKRNPNCCILGITIIQILDKLGALHRDEKTGYCYFENLKLYLDGDNEGNISVGYTPFLELEKKIIL